MELNSVLFRHLALLILFHSCKGQVENGAELKMDKALLSFHNQMNESVNILYTSEFCYKCVFQRIVSVKPSSNASAIISTKFPLIFAVYLQNRNASLCRWSQTYGEGGHYSVWIQMSGTVSSCVFTVDKTANNIYLPLLGAALSLAVIALLFILVSYMHRRRYTSAIMKTICCQGSQHSLDNDGTEACENGNNTSKPKPSRLFSLDAFRGFSLTIMVFVNYGGGGYWFFQHAPWNGLTVADIVMPWFVFIIGTSVVLAFRSMQRRGVSKLQLLRKITWRTAVLLMLGFCFLNYSPRDGLLSLSWLRIPGVLQRLGFTYFVLSLLQTFWGQEEVPVKVHHWWNPIQDVFIYWPQWIIILLLETLWLCITFLMPVPDCPTGYLGAGGIGDGGLYPKCTGGAAGYIDKWIFGDKIYRYPTCKELYQTTEPFDPEGLLGTINSVVMGFLGMQAGKIIIVFRGRNVHILCRFLVWAILLGISAAILSKCTRDGGFIPVNKNLWSLSYVTCMGFFSFLLLGGMFFVIDVKGWWRGQPFIYPGMNSIFVYVGHSLLGFYFPFSWEIRFQSSHWEWLFQSLWGTALWLLISYMLYRKKFFLKI